MIDMSREDTVSSIVGIFFIMIIIGAVVGGLYMYPKYKIYKLEMNGKAELAEAQWSKQIQIEEAKGRLEASRYERETQLIQANTTAEANRIVAGSLDPLYIQYLMVTKMADGNTQQIIYIPTEAGIPLLEAGKTVTQAEAQ
jgi:hypothetical protein